MSVDLENQDALGISVQPGQVERALVVKSLVTKPED